MYITGTIDSFSSRLHQLPALNNPTGQAYYGSGIFGVNQFVLEGQSYIAAGLVTAGLSGQWEQEARKQRYLLSGDANAMLVQMF